jgi:hypothetical protein
MTKQDFYKLAGICGANRRLAKKSGTPESIEQSESMAEWIAHDIYDLARKELYYLNIEEWATFRTVFFDNVYPY